MITSTSNNCKIFFIMIHYLINFFNLFLSTKYKNIDDRFYGMIDENMKFSY